MSKRPAPIKQKERRHVGETFDYSQTFNGNKVEVSGTVVFSDAGSTFMKFDDSGREYNGVLNITKLTFQTSGMKYAVTINGKLLHEPTASLFPTLAEAAEFAGV